VPVLRRLAGRTLAADDQLRLLLETEYVQCRGTHGNRHLLRGKDLRGVLRQQEQLLIGENLAAKTEYPKACLRRRIILRRAAGGPGIAAVASLYGAIRGVDTLQQE
jgi:hypothetical protein